MTKVELTHDGDIYVLLCRGHAQTPELCAAVSTLCYTLAGFLHTVPAWVQEAKLDPGDVRIEFVSRHVSARDAFNMTAVGFLQLEKSCRDGIKVTVKDD